MKPIAKFAGIVALLVVLGLLTSGLVTFAITAVVAMARAPEGTSFDGALSDFVNSDSPLALALGIVPTSAAFLIIGLRAAHGRREELRLWGARTLDFVLGTTGMVAISTAAGALVSLLGLVDEGSLAELNKLFVNMPMHERLMMLPVTALCPGVAEEVFFRGFVLGRGQRQIGTRAAVVLSAIAFGAVHLDPGHIVAATIMGGYLAFVVLRTGSLWVAIVAHVVNNALATLAPELNSSGTDSVELSLAALGGGIAIGALMMAAIAKRHHRIEPVVS